MLKRVCSMTVMGLVGMMMVGCCAPTRLNVTVSLDDAMQKELARLGNRNIQVDMVFVNADQAERWQNYSMNRYWEAGDQLRASADKKSFVFNATQNQPQTLSMKDPAWDKWLANAGSKDKVYVYVLALMPQSFDDQPGGADARRKILPANACRWSSTDVKLVVKPSGLENLTPPLPEK